MNAAPTDIDPRPIVSDQAARPAPPRWKTFRKFGRENVPVKQLGCVLLIQCRNDASSIIGFEVALLQWRKNIKGAYEWRYPPSSKWGQQGWTYPSNGFHRANEKFEVLKPNPKSQS